MPTPESASITARDVLGRVVRLPATPTRIVSLVPSLTELLFDLGLDEEVVGLTRFCVRPPGWKARKTRVGGTKQVDLGRVAALAPDLVLANREENTREDVEALSEIAPVYVTDVATVEQALDMIRGVGALCDRAERAAALAGEIEAGFAELGAELAARGSAPRAAYLIWRRPYMTVGGDTFISDVMIRAGLINAFGERTRYPEVDVAELAAAELDLLMLSSEPFPFKETHAAELAGAVPGPRVLLVDGELFSWYGSRLRHTPAYLRTLAR